MTEHNELIYMSATELIGKFKSKKLSPVEVLEAQIERWGDIGDQVNCVTYTHFDDARTAAKESEKRYANGNPRPLEGITVGVKDEHGRAGWIVTQGSLLYRDHRLGRNDVMADNLISLRKKIINHY